MARYKKTPWSSVFWLVFIVSILMSIGVNLATIDLFGQ